MRFSTTTHAATTTAVALFAGIACQPAAAADYYAGKTVSLIVGSGTGGGYDRYGRVVARYMPKYVPGTPTMIVKNMPGAGSMKAVEYIFSVAEKDGLTFGIVFPGALVEPLYNAKKKFRFEPPKLEYLGSANSGTRVCVTYGTSKVKTMADAVKLEAAMGGNAAGSSTTDYAEMMNNLAGTKFKIVNGYKSSSNVVLAMERSELDGMCGLDASSFRSQRPDWYNTPKSHMIVQSGLEPDAELLKLGVPSMWDFVKGRNRTVAELIVGQQEFHRPFVAPPGTPPAQMAILREAFEKTMKDKDFLAEATKQKLDIAPKSGAIVSALIKKMYGAPKDIATAAGKALNR